MIKVLSPGKINLCLQVGRRRKDGYHELRTLFALLKLGDVIEVHSLANGDDGKQRGDFVCEPDKNFKFCLRFDRDYPTHCRRELLQRPDKNFVVQAYRSLKCQFPFIAKENILVKVTKILPTGAGLGGGSSNAAFGLEAMARFFRLPMSRKKLLAASAELGSDAPFFLCASPERPLWWATGRGDCLSLYPERFSSHALLIYPGFGVATPWAYGALDRLKGSLLTTKAILPRLKLGSGVWHRTNSFEEVIFKKYPILTKAKECLMRMGAREVSLTGSGSCIYALAQKLDHCYQWKRRIKTTPVFKGFHYYITSIAA